MVVMQNSGLGVSLNALGSLHILYELPVLLLVTWRGYQGKDAPEHLVMGEVLPGLLDLLRHPVSRSRCRGAARRRRLGGGDDGRHRASRSRWWCGPGSSRII